MVRNLTQARNSMPPAKDDRSVNDAAQPIISKSINAVTAALRKRPSSGDRISTPPSLHVKLIKIKFKSILKFFQPLSTMAWRSSGSVPMSFVALKCDIDDRLTDRRTNAELINNLRDNGLIASTRVYEAMLVSPRRN